MVNPIYVAYHHLPDAPRRTRRTLALLAFIGIPLQYLGYVTLVANGLLAPALWAPISVALFAMTLIGYVGVVGFARGRAEMSADLDERQSQVRIGPSRWPTASSRRPWSRSSPRSRSTHPSSDPSRWT